MNLEQQINQAFRDGVKAGRAIERISPKPIDTTPHGGPPMSVREADERRRSQVYAVDTPTAEILQIPLAPTNTTPAA